MRVREGHVELGDMNPGNYRVLRQNEVKKLKKETGLE
jgi:16S rRNA U516 pseudouridylate synthase RsuA-like enzyme